jgi:hypothetical protein
MPSSRQPPQPKPCVSRPPSQRRTPHPTICFSTHVARCKVWDNKQTSRVVQDGIRRRQQEAPLPQWPPCYNRCRSRNKLPSHATRLLQKHTMQPRRHNGITGCLEECRPVQGEQARPTAGPAAGLHHSHSHATSHARCPLGWWDHPVCYAPVGPPCLHIFPSTNPQPLELQPPTGPTFAHPRGPTGG